MSQGTWPIQQVSGHDSANSVLVSAAQRVLAESLDGGLEAWADTADELASLTLAIQAGASERALPREEGSTSHLRRRLLAQLEAEVTQRQHEPERFYDDDLTRELVSALDQIRHLGERSASTCTDPDFSGPLGNELVAEIAHDLRSPLTSILTLTETLREGRSGAVNEVQQRQLGLLYSAALALSSTASDLIELAQGGDKLAEKELSPFSVAELLDSIKDIVAPMVQEKGLTLRVDADGPDSRLGYPLALSRVLLNLTTNALKFTNRGFVELAARSTGPVEMRFSVRDTGIGIDAGSLDTLYQPFRPRADGQGYCFSGTGLGLVICRRLVAALDSELQLETRPEWGTRFFFDVELSHAEELV